jgi:hypothetical protein
MILLMGIVAGAVFGAVVLTLVPRHRIDGGLTKASDPRSRRDSGPNVILTGLLLWIPQPALRQRSSPKPRRAHHGDVKQHICGWSSASSTDRRGLSVS